MYINKFNKNALLIGLLLSLSSHAYAEVAAPGSQDYNDGICVEKEPVVDINIGSEKYLRFKVQDEWFNYSSKIDKDDAKGVYKILLSSLLTGNKVTAYRRGSDCSQEMVTGIVLHTE